MLIRVFSHKGSNVATSQEQAQAVAEALLENRSEWFEQLVRNPDSFRDVERDVDQQVRTAGGQFVVALLQEASETPALQAHVGRVRLQAAVPTQRVTKNPMRLYVPLCRNTHFSEKLQNSA